MLSKIMFQGWIFTNLYRHVEQVAIIFLSVNRTFNY